MQAELAQILSEFDELADDGREKRALDRSCGIAGENGFLDLAERVGFEPTVEFPLHTLSKRAPSTTRTSLRVVGNQSSTGEWMSPETRIVSETVSDLLSVLRSLTGSGLASDGPSRPVISRSQYKRRGLSIVHLNRPEAAGEDWVDSI